MEGLEVRQVTADDYDDVIAIRPGIYEGRDYLPALYKGMIRTHQGYVAVLQGKMVAFLFAILLDNGSTFVMRAGRVSKNCEGKGLYRHLTDYIIEQNKGKCGATKKITVVHSQEVAEGLTEKGNFPIFQRDVYNCWARTSKVLKQTPDTHDHQQRNIQTLTTEELYQLLENEILLDAISPERYLVLNWVPLKLLKSDIEMIIQELKNVHIIASFLGTQDPHKSPMLSFGYTYDCDLGTRLNIDFVGSSNDPDGIKDHVTAHMKNLITSECSSFLGFFTSRSSKDGEVMKSVLKNLDFDLESYVNFKMYGFETAL